MACPLIAKVEGAEAAAATEAVAEAVTEVMATVICMYM